MKSIKTKYGLWSVISIHPKGKQGVVCKCRCVCGTESMIPATALRAKRSTQCKNCAKRFRFYANKYNHEEWIGRKFHKLEVLSIGEMSKEGMLYFCRCECGVIKQYCAAKLKANKIKQCLSCSNAEKNRTHGFCETPEYKIWGAIKYRCRNPKNKQYKYYGARGIDICEKWHNSFAEFIKDVGFRPEKDFTLDRIDNNKGYEPGNVRWVTMQVNSNNTRRNVFYQKDGQSYTARDLANKFDVPFSRINWCLIRYGIEWVFDNVEKVRVVKKKTKPLEQLPL